jgi:tetratricopeptide (TPR) repeat protein
MRAQHELGRHDAVAQHYREGVAAVRFHLGRHHPALVELHVRFGELQLRLAKALRCSLPPLPAAASRSPLGAQLASPSARPSEATVAVLRQRESRLALARDSFEQAEVLAHTALGSSHPACARLALHLGDYASEMGDGAEAVSAFMRAVAMFDATALPDAELDAATARVTLSETLALRGDVAGALAVAEEALLVRIAVRCVVVASLGGVRCSVRHILLRADPHAYSALPAPSPSRPLSSPTSLQRLEAGDHKLMESYEQAGSLAEKLGRSATAIRYLEPLLERLKVSQMASSDAAQLRRMQVSFLLFTVTFYANRAHNLTRSL